MKEILKDWVILGNGFVCGSFDSRNDADDWANALASLRGISCVVKPREEVR